MMKIYRTGAVKLRILLFTAQIISSFTSISEETGAKTKYPQPAANVAGALGIANFGIFSFVSLRCMVPNTNFYTRLFMRTTTPFAIMALLFTYPLALRLLRKPHQAALKSSMRLSMLMLEVILPSTSTIIGYVPLRVRKTDIYVKLNTHT
jgi:hypothetical protein